MDVRYLIMLATILVSCTDDTSENPLIIYDFPEHMIINQPEQFTVTIEDENLSIPISYNFDWYIQSANFNDYSKDDDIEYKTTSINSSILLFSSTTDSITIYVDINKDDITINHSQIIKINNY